MTPQKAQRPQAVQGTTHKFEVACNDVFAILNGWDNEDNRELFLKCGPQGSCTAATMNALSVLFSIARRCGVPLVSIAHLFICHGGSCHKAMKSGMPTCIFALGELLSEQTAEEEDWRDGTPIVMAGKFRIRFTGCGPMMVSCGSNSDDALTYVDVKLAKTNTCANTITSAVADLITLMLGHGVEPDKIITALRGISCPAARDENQSCIDGIGRAICDHIIPPELEGPVISDEEEIGGLL